MSERVYVGGAALRGRGVSESGDGISGVLGWGYVCVFRYT